MGDKPVKRIFNKVSVYKDLEANTPIRIYETIKPVDFDGGMMKVSPENGGVVVINLPEGYVVETETIKVY